MSQPGMGKRKARRAELLLLAAAMLLAGGWARAAPRLIVERVDTKGYPIYRAFVSVVNSEGNAVSGLGKDVFHIYKEGGTKQIPVREVSALDQSPLGVAVALVIQASGNMQPAMADIKKAAAAFLSGQGDKDMSAIVDYSDQTEVLSPFSADKGDLLGKLGKLQAELGSQGSLLYDGVDAALGLFLTKGATQLPPVGAVLVFSDGYDVGSAADAPKVVADALKKRIPIYAIGHSEVGDDRLPQLADLAHQTGGFYVSAPTADGFTRAFGRIRDQIGKLYVVSFSGERMATDGKKHRIDVAVQVAEDATPLRGSILFDTPLKHRWGSVVVLALLLLFAVVGGLTLFVLLQPKPAPERICPACKRPQMPEWEVCLFCLKSAKAKLSVQKGPSKGKVYPLVGKMVQIGSGPENGIRLLDPAVSSKHAGISIEDIKFEVIDLGSRNGVLVNGRKVPRRFLRNGDVITLGQSELRFDASVATAADDAAD